MEVFSKICFFVQKRVQILNVMAYRHLLPEYNQHFMWLHELATLCRTLCNKKH